MPHGVHEGIEVRHKENDESGDSYPEGPSFVKEFEEVDCGVLQGHDANFMLAPGIIATKEGVPQEKCQTWFCAVSKADV